MTEAVEASRREASTQKTEEKLEEAEPNAGVEEEKMMQSSQAESRQEEQEGGEAVRHEESLAVGDQPRLELLAQTMQTTHQPNSKGDHSKEHIALTPLPLSAGQQG